ncbi:restriction endonuclease subunit S [Microbacterium sp. LRZ72]|uniref:restriction endonuclease subunit S n=1 Tax=Microbacterium sp. LRZ72 TaxID=2942481 RepID=UPI0029AA4A52|nr:restriction endonuclease subunit S [Microbacterium sp. LRZ72]MDX2377302.1 restriction endonuclease subunit S [Microbacterium sp. LRZ72]
MVPLNQLIAPVQGRAGAAELPVYSVTKRAGFVPSAQYFKKQVFSSDLSTYKVVDKGQFAYATIHLDEGSIGIAPTRCVISPMYTVFSIDESRVSAEYLIRFLKSPRALASYPRLGRGTAERRKSISLDALGRLEVPLPPLPEQRRIAAILDEADALRTRTGVYLDALRAANAAALRSTRTGDCAERLLGDFVTRISSGKSIVGADHEAGAQVLKISAVTSGAFREEEAKPLPVGYVPPPEHFVRAGDLLVSRANTEALVGASAYVWGEPSEPRVLPDKLWRVAVKDIDPIYLQAVISAPDFRRQVSRRASGSGGAMKNIGQRDYLSIPVTVAPRNVQEQFVEQVRELRRVENSVIVRAAGLDGLFTSLQHRAFRGEL